MESAETNQVRRGNRLPTLAILLAVLTVVAYLPALRGDFVFDDYSLIINNRMVKASDGLYRFWFTTEGLDYWPLTSSAWWLEWRWWGTNPLGYHAVNVLLHAANAILVWIVLKHLRVPGAWVAGCVFALHPVNAATVAWVSEQKNTLSMLFYAVAMLLYLRFYEEGQWRWYGLSLAAFLLALLSKTAVVMLPVVLLGCIWWTRGRVRREDLLRSVPFFALSLVMGLVTVWYQYPRAVGGHAIRTENFCTRLAVAGSTPWFYLGKTLLPINLTAIYPKWEIDASSWVSYVPGVVLFGSLALFWWKRNTWGTPLLFGLGYFVVTLFPVSGIFHQRFHLFSFVADPWLYHSIAGVIALVVAAGVEICRRLGPRGRSVGVVASAGMLIVLGAATWGRAGVYATDETLWRDTLTKNPKAWAAHNNLGLVLSQAGKTEEAIAQYEQALRIKPDYAEAHCHLAATLGQAGRVAEAMAHLEQALRINPEYADAHNDLGNALMLSGRMPEAMAHLEQALRIDPDCAEAHYNLGVALGRAGRTPEAIGHFEQALRIKPNYAEAHYNLGVAFEQGGKVPEAIAHYEQALRINPNYAEAHYNLGVALGRTGRMPEAIGHFEQALRINPNYAEAHYNLGVALGQAGKVPEAIGHFEQALRIKPDLTQAQSALARLRGGP